MNVAVNLPLFRPGESPFRRSIEGGYIGIARFFTNHPNPWGWDPFVYCGLPAQSLYLPLVHYAIAILVWIAGIPVDYAYRLVTSAAVCLVPVAVFLLVQRTSGSARWALATAAAYSLFSPAYGLLRPIDLDRSGTQLPWKIIALMKYGEGPHIVGLVLMPLAILALWTAARGRSRWQIGIAGAALAAVTLTNWVASFAMGLLFLILLLGLWRSADAKDYRLSRLFAAAALGYLLACFWLTPALIRTVLFNWPADTYNYHIQRAQSLSLLGLLIGLALLKTALWWVHARGYLSFVTLACFCFGWLVNVRYSYGLDTIPESHRYTMEFELFLLLALFEWGRAARKSGDSVKQACAIGCGAIMLLAGAGQLRLYLQHAYADWRPVPKESTAEHRVATWLAKRDPRGRVLASGGLRFRLNSWFDLQQVGGSFESGLRNRIPFEYAQKIRFEADGSEAVRKMKAMGVEYVAVHTAESAEFYRDYKHPERLEGLLERVYSDAGDIVYRLPFDGLARTAGAVLTSEWRGPSEFLIRGAVRQNQPVSVLINWDPGWQGTQDGRLIRVERDEIGLIRLNPAAGGKTDIVLRYEGTAEQKAMALVSAMAWIGAAIWIWRERRVQSAWRSKESR